MDTLRVSRTTNLQADVRVPSDKSISHRAAILGALATGETPIHGYLTAEDTLNTARALAAAGVAIEGLATSELVVHGVGLRGLRAPAQPLELGNSGTGMRLLTGVLAGQSFTTTLTGDASLSRRPMDRIARPLGLMGVTVEGHGERCTPPLTVHGGTVRAIHYDSPVASAQVKSAVLLAGLFAPGTTTVSEPARSRDHTERMLAAFGATVSCDALTVGVAGEPCLKGTAVAVPGDLSSAAYLLAAALLCPDSAITVREVILNPTRAGLLAVLQRMGAPLEVLGEQTTTGEHTGDVRATTCALAATSCRGAEIPCLIDEVPLLAVIATRAEGTTEVRDAAELRVKECDRLAATAAGLRAMGADIEELPDGLLINGPTRLHGATVDAEGDHRIAMSFAVAGLVAEGPTFITGAACIATSFPGFTSLMRDAGATIERV